jgi:hypothetical protein
MRYRLKDGAGMDTYPPLENLCLKGNTMPIGFEQQNNLQVYGDGNGNIIIEEWSDDNLSDLLGKVTISLDRFEQICDVHREDLQKEAYGINI